MWRPNWVWTGALIAALASASVVSARVKLHVPTPGYQCNVGKAFDDRVWGSATLDEMGRVISSNWTWRTPAMQPAYGLIILGRDTNPLSNPIVNTGTAFVEWHDIPDARVRPKKRRVQLTTSPAKRFDLSAISTGSWEQSFTPHVMIYWPDLLAFARGAPAINLNLLDAKSRFIGSVAIEPSQFMKAQEDIDAMLRALNARVANYAEECEKVDDIYPDDIVVT